MIDKFAFNQKRKISKRTDIKSRTVLAVSISIFVTSLIVQLYVTNDLAVKGTEMVALQARKNELTKEVSEIELEQSKYSSLRYIETQAYAQGYIKNDNYVSLISNDAKTAVLPQLK